MWREAAEYDICWLSTMFLDFMDAELRLWDITNPPEHSLLLHLAVLAGIQLYLSLFMAIGAMCS